MAELEWQLFSGLREASKEGLIYVPPGKTELRRAERRVEGGSRSDGQMARDMRFPDRCLEWNLSNL